MQGNGAPSPAPTVQAPGPGVRQFYLSFMMYICLSNETSRLLHLAYDMTLQWWMWGFRDMKLSCSSYNAVFC